MTSRLAGRFSIFGLIFFVFKSLLGIAKQWSGKNVCNFFSYVRISIYIERGLLRKAEIQLLLVDCNVTFHTVPKIA